MFLNSRIIVFGLDILIVIFSGFWLKLTGREV